MSETQLVILTDPPSYFAVGSGQDFGFLEKSIIGAAIDDARAVAQHVDVADSDSEEVRDLKGQIRKLANTVTDLSGQIFQIAHAIEHGRIAVVRND